VLSKLVIAAISPLGTALLLGMAGLALAAGAPRRGAAPGCCSSPARSAG